MKSQKANSISVILLSIALIVTVINNHLAHKQNLETWQTQFGANAKVLDVITTIGDALDSMNERNKLQHPQQPDFK